MKQRVVLALGGNALQKNGEATAEAQKKVAESVGEVVAELAGKYEIVIAHGNGPQRPPVRRGKIWPGKNLSKSG